jgi:hypothetical protein
MECRRLIQLFLELKCERVPVANFTVIIAHPSQRNPSVRMLQNGAIIWHVLRVTDDSQFLSRHWFSRFFVS